MLTFIPKTAQQTNTWSGGTTTQLWIYPETAAYIDRDFECRISTATIDTETSDFSDLTGYTRHLMTLSNPITLYEGNAESFILNPLVEHIFDGGISMRSIGKTRDFNVMLKAPWKTRITVISNDPSPTTDRKCHWQAFYVLKGSMAIHTASRSIALVESDFVILDDEENYTLDTAPVLLALSIELWK